MSEVVRCCQLCAGMERAASGGAANNRVLKEEEEEACLATQITCRRAALFWFSYYIGVCLGMGAR